MKTWNGNIEGMEKMQMEIAGILKSRGFKNVFTPKSVNSVGRSYYVHVMANDFRDLMKFRISDHSVTNIYRLQSEYHVYPEMTAVQAVQDVFGDNNADKY